MPPTNVGPGTMTRAEALDLSIAERRYGLDNTPTRTALADRLGLLLRDWRSIANAGALLGRATIELGNGLVISDIGIFAKAGAEWAQFPAEPQRDRDGQIVEGERGKVNSRHALRWRDRALQDEFSRELMEAIERQCGPLGGGP
jgi:hypothetical protein